jgi:hypothetical protein
MLVTHGGPRRSNSRKDTDASPLDRDEGRAAMR